MLVLQAADLDFRRRAADRGYGPQGERGASVRDVGDRLTVGRPARSKHFAALERELKRITSRDGKQPQLVVAGAERDVGNFGFVGGPRRSSVPDRCFRQEEVRLGGAKPQLPESASTENSLAIPLAVADEHNFFAVGRPTRRDVLMGVGQHGSHRFVFGRYRRQPEALAEIRRREKNRVSIGRPAGVHAEDLAVGELAKAGAVGVHYPDVDRVAGVARKGDLPPVGRPARLGVIVGPRGNLHRLAALGGDLPQAALHGHDDLATGRRPRRGPRPRRHRREVDALHVHLPGRAGRAKDLEVDSRNLRDMGDERRDGKSTEQEQ